MRGTAACGDGVDGLLLVLGPEAQAASLRCSNHYAPRLPTQALF